METLSVPSVCSGSDVAATPAYWVGGHIVRFLRTGEQTEGRYVMFEITTPADPTICPPPHTHETAEESFYVAEGEIEVFVSGVWSRVVAGGFATVPRGMMHTFRTVGERPSRVVVTVTPAGLDKFFSDPDVGIPVATSEIAKELANPPKLTQQQVEKFVAAIGKYDMKMPG